MAIVTQYHKLAGIRPQKLFSCSSGGSRLCLLLASAGGWPSWAFLELRHSNLCLSHHAAFFPVCDAVPAFFSSLKDICHAR